MGHHGKVNGYKDGAVVSGAPVGLARGPVGVVGHLEGVLPDPLALLHLVGQANPVLEVLGHKAQQGGLL